MYKWLCYLVCQFLAINFCLSQDFMDYSEESGVDHKYYGGYLAGGVSFFDFNQDGWDDLSMPSGNGLSKFYINNEGTFEEIDLLSLPGDVKSLIWVDFDNDGDYDLSVTELNGKYRLFENTGDLQLEEILLDFPSNFDTFNSGISWGDYDGDGLLDFYVTRYPEITQGNMEEASNLLIRNLGDGAFEDVTEQLNVGNGYQHSFISTWADFDNDGDQDLYVVNDRFSFPNALYDNNGDGTFTDVTEQSNANIMILAMSSTVGDFDNDTDLDIYCTNTYTGNHLLKNNGSSFFNNLFPYSGTETFQFTWGANWVDYDNNGWKDLFVCAGEFNDDNRNYLYINNQNGTFLPSSQAVDDSSNDSHAAAKGDLDHDGKYDLIILNEAPDNSRFLLNTTETEHYHVKLDLTGTVSNRDAIGTRIVYYIDGQSHSEYTTCGSNYLSQDSQHLILGLGQSSFIDSLEIRWPSGLCEWYYTIPQSTELHLTEGSSYHASIIADGQITLCENEEVTLSLNQDFEQITWSTGDSGSSVTLTEAGEYWATIQEGNYFQFNSDTIFISQGVTPIIDSVITTMPSCFGAEDGLAIAYYTLNEDSISQWQLNDLSAGNHSYQLQHEDICPATVSFLIEQPSELVSTFTLDHIECAEELVGSIDVQCFGGCPDYYISTTPSFPLDSLPPGAYELIIYDENGCMHTNVFEINQEISLSYELIVTDAISDETGSVEIIPLNSVSIESFTVVDSFGESQSASSLPPGDYTVSITDVNGCMHTEAFTISLVEGISSQGTMNDILLWPNPAHTFIHVEQCQSPLRLELYTPEGKLLHNIGSSATESLQLDVSPLPNGMYIARITCGNTLTNNLFIKE